MITKKCVPAGLLLSLCCIILTGCNQTVQSGRGNEEAWIIKRDGEVEEHLFLQLDKDFSELEGGKILHAQQEVKPYKQDKDKFCEKYFSKVKNVNYSETQKNEYMSSNVCYAEEGRPYNSLTLSEDTYDLYSEKADLILHMVQSGNAVSFLRRDIKKQYPKQELSFMTSKEALELGNKVMEEGGYQYDPAYTECYALDKENLNKALEKEELEDGLLSLSDMAGFVREEKEFQDSDETYLLFYPLLVDHIPLSSNTEFSYITPYSYVLVDHTGVYAFWVGENVSMLDREEKEIMSPDKAVNRIIHLFQNMVLAQDFIIQDMDLEYQITSQDSETGEITLSPVWIFVIRIMDAEGTGSTVEQMDIDAVTGRQMVAG